MCALKWKSGLHVKDRAIAASRNRRMVIETGQMVASVRCLGLPLGKSIARFIIVGFAVCSRK